MGINPPVFKTGALPIRLTLQTDKQHKIETLFDIRTQYKEQMLALIITANAVFFQDRSCMAVMPRAR